MAKRKIIKIDEEKCDGCGLCVPNCPEGALQIIDGKARLISETVCDGLGACLGHCPRGAIIIEEREAAPYSEKKVMESIVKQGRNTIIAHLQHLKEHGEHSYLKEALGFLKDKGMKIDFEKSHSHDHGHGASGCPGSKMMDFRKTGKAKEGVPAPKFQSRLGQWPIQIHLVPPHAPYFEGADILIAADCVPFAYPDFHEDLLKGKILLVGCPKLDDIESYGEKISMIIKDNDIKTVTYAHMEVPCCFGLVGVIKDAITSSGKNIPFEEVTIGIKGERLK